MIMIQIMIMNQSLHMMLEEDLYRMEILHGKKVSQLKSQDCDVTMTSLNCNLWQNH